MKFTRRNLVAGAALAAGVASPSIARAQTKRWRMVTSWPKRLPGPGMSAERVAERIKLLSGGRLEITVAAAGEIVPAFEVLGATSPGRRDRYAAGLDFYRRQQQAVYTARAVRADAQRACRLGRGRRRAGAVGRALCAVRGQAVHGRQYRRLHGRLVSPRDQGRDDIKGVKIRSLGLGGEVSRRSGRRAADHAARGNPAVAAIRRARCGGICRSRLRYRSRPLSRGADVLCAGLQQAERHRRGHRLAEGVEFARCRVQAIVFVHACAAEAAYALSEMERLNVEALNALVTQHHVKLMTFPTDLVRAAAKNPPTCWHSSPRAAPMRGRCTNSYLAFRDKVSPWSKISLRAVLEARG